MRTSAASVSNSSELQPFFVSDQSILKAKEQVTPKALQDLANINRIHCLAGLKSAKHGWLGANFSAMEILTAIYSLYIKNPSKSISERPVAILSKGHAAMALYAILRSFNCLTDTDLMSYKSLNGLPAHCDSNIIGVDADSGSLGQGLSKAIGIAQVNKMSGKTYPIFVLIGDGELQEGQLFEAFLTLKKLNLSNCIPIIDRNHLQSDSQTADIKDAKDWEKVFLGIGLEVSAINGHNISDITSALKHRVQSDLPGVVIADTIKGFGSKLTSMSKTTERRKAVWHGKIPDNDDYIKIIEELVSKIDSKEIRKELEKYRNDYFDKNSKAIETIEQATKTANISSTAKGFADALIEVANNHKNVYFLDADLEKSCNLTELASTHQDRFLEIGISEQDMCSIANGIGLNGAIAVVNTYASFYKRAVDQIFACATEKVPVIFAGHYAGIDYFSDGKSHQSVNDIGIFRAIEDIDIFEPLSAKHARSILFKVIKQFQQDINNNNKSKPSYIRLHRTPVLIEELSSKIENNIGLHIEFKNEVPADYLIFTSGPHMLKTALEIQKLFSKQSIYIDVVAIVEISQKVKYPFKQYKKVFCIEDNLRDTGLGANIALNGDNKIIRIGVSDFFQSTRSFSDMRQQHKLDIQSISKIVQKAISCNSH